MVIPSPYPPPKERKLTQLYTNLEQSDPPHPSLQTRIIFYTLLTHEVYFSSYFLGSSPPQGSKIQIILDDYCDNDEILVCYILGLQSLFCLILCEVLRFAFIFSICLIGMKK